MKHMTALIIKFIIVAVVLVIILGVFTNLSTRQILFVSLAITAVTYLIGDLLILTVFNNAVAAVADAGMCWLIIYLSNYVWTDRSVSLLSALSAAVLIGIGEIFLHIYIEKNILHHPPRDPNAGTVG